LPAFDRLRDYGLGAADSSSYQRRSESIFFLIRGLLTIAIRVELLTPQADLMSADTEVLGSFTPDAQVDLRAEGA
jgi:hypothetical protein